MDGKISTGWDVDVFKKQFYLSRRNFNYTMGLLSVPYCIHVFNSVMKIREIKKETGKIDKKEFSKLAITDTTLMLGGMIAYAFLLRKGNMKINPRFS